MENGSKVIVKSAIPSCEFCQNSTFEEDSAVNYFSFFCSEEGNLPGDMVDMAFVTEDASNCTGFKPIIVEKCIECGKELNIPKYQAKYFSDSVLHEMIFCSKECKTKGDWTPR